MEQLSKVNFDTLGRWALGASLLHGIGTVTRNNRFEPMAMPFYVSTLHTFIQPLCVQTDLEFVSPGMRAFSGICLLSAVMIRSSIEKQDELSKTLKSFHAVNEMVTLAAFVTTVVAIIFATEGRKLCIAAATIQALCYINRFYHEAAYLKIKEKKSNEWLPEGIVDVTALMKGKKSVYLGREEFVADVLGVLRSNFETNNPLLVGPAGSGKTELIHYLAVEINEGRLEGFEGWKVYKTNCKELVSNTKYLGELPKKINEIFSYLRGKKAILFIDEIHQALSDGRSTHSPDSSIAEGLLTHLTDPGIRVVAATTSDHYLKLFSNEPFQQRFHFQPMPRMTAELRNRILSDRLTKLQGDFPDVNIPDNYEELLIQCLESKGERRGLRALIALLSVVVEQMHRKKTSFEETLQKEMERMLELEVGVLESKGLIASDQFIEKLKQKASSSRQFGKEFQVLHLVLQQRKTLPEERNLDKLLEQVPPLAH